MASEATVRHQGNQPGSTLVRSVNPKLDEVTWYVKNSKGTLYRVPEESGRDLEEAYQEHKRIRDAEREWAEENEQVPAEFPVSPSTVARIVWVVLAIVVLVVVMMEVL